VDFLFYGSGNGGPGLLHWSGVASDNHDGQLKRICGPIISLIKWLITMDTEDEYGNIYRDRFIHFPAEDLLKINFIKHVNIKGESKVSKSLGAMGQSRQGSVNDAFEILSIICLEHRSLEDDEDDPIEPGYFLENNKLCLERFSAWQRENNIDNVRSLELTISYEKLS
jgi:hypothetical protein